MVYFGKKVYRTRRPGFSPREKLLITLPIMLLVGVLLIIIVLEAGTVSPESDLPVGQVERGSPGPPAGGTRAGRAATAGMKLPPLPKLGPARAFVERPDILRFVRDLGQQNPEHPPAAEMVAVEYLFHRWRAGIDVPSSDEPPDRKILAGSAARFRGKRFTLRLETVARPWPAAPELPLDNASGVRYFNEVWGIDDHRHMHRVLFFERDHPVPEGTSLVVDADFLRMHEYLTQGNRPGMSPATDPSRRAQVPQWIAARLELDPGVDLGSWSKGGILLVLAVSLVGIGLVVLIQVWPGSRERYESRRRKGAEHGLENAAT